MPKISEYDDLVTPQGTEDFAIARGGTSKKLIWSKIKSYLMTKYLGYGLGVTTGDSHAHVSGRGAQVLHHILGDIGLNTHDQIDDYINGIGRDWAVLTASEYAFYSTILSAPASLTFTALAGYWYAIRFRTWFQALTGDSFSFKLSPSLTAEGMLKIVTYPPNSIVGTTYIETPGATHTVAGFNDVGSGYIEIDGIMKRESSDISIAFYAAQGAGSTYAVSIYGAYLEYMLMG